MIDITFIWPGTGCPDAEATWESHCRLRLFRHDGRHVVVLTEPEGNSGTSVTNAAEYLATRITDHFNLDPTTTVWVEHYGPWREGGETFDFVTFTWHGHRACRPEGQRVKREEVEQVVGEPLTR